MSQALTVPTHFSDIAELSQGFLDRVEQDTFILYGPVPHEEGSTVEFAILLADGSAAIEGVGVVRASVDGGEDRIPETRYDIVLGELSLDGRNEVVFESLVLAREAVSERPESIEEASAEALAADEESEVELSSAEAQLDSLSPAGLEAMDAEELLAAGSSGSAASSAELSSEISLDSEPLESADASLEAYRDEFEETPVEASSETLVEAEPSESEDAPLEADQSQTEPPSSEAETDSEISMAAEQNAQSWDDDEPSIHGTFEESPESALVESTPAPLDVVSELAQLDDGDPDATSADAELGPEASIPPIDASIPPAKPRAAEPPSEPPPPPSFSLEAPAEGLTRPSRANASDSEPPPVELQELDQPGSGLFQYEEGLPIPSRPPLPNLDPTRRVVAAELPLEPDSEPPLELVQSDRPSSQPPVELVQTDRPSSEPPFVEEGYEDVRLAELEERFEKG